MQLVSRAISFNTLSASQLLQLFPFNIAMRMKEWVRFSSRDYRERINQCDDHVIRDRIYEKRRKLTSAKTSRFWAVIAAPITAGGSIISFAISARNVRVERKKREVLEDIWRGRGNDELSLRPKDKWLPMALASCLGCCMCYVDHGIASAAASNAAYSIPYDSSLAHHTYEAEEKAANFVGKKVMKKI